MAELLRQFALTTLLAALFAVAVPAQANPCFASVDPCFTVMHSEEGFRQTYQVFCYGGTEWHVDEVWRWTYVGCYDDNGDFNEMQRAYSRSYDDIYDTGQECGTQTGAP